MHASEVGPKCENDACPTTALAGATGNGATMEE